MSTDAECLKLLVIGAHPDDAEFRAGGLASLYRQRGNAVKFISVTNGAAGHHLATAIPHANVLRPPFGHIGMMASVQAPDAVWQPIAGWLRGRFA